MKSLADKKIVDPSLLLSSLEFSLLVGAGLVKDEVALQRRLIKLNTGLVYRQQKYNLLREELEGYARLAVVLAKMPPSRGDSNIDQYITNVLSLVGSFDLDPNRVLDVILDCFEEQPLNLSFVLLLGTFRRANILHILGFKYTLYTNKEVPATESKESVGTGAKENTTVVKRVQAACAPFTLHLITAMLLTNGVVTLDELLPYFANTAQDTASKAAVKEKSIESEVKSFGVINLKVTPSTKAVETKADRAPLPNELAPKITVAPLLGGTKPPPPMYPPPETTKSIPGGSLLANALQKVTSSPAIAGADGVSFFLSQLQSSVSTNLTFSLCFANFRK